MATRFSRLGAELKQIRNRLGVTQVDLAKVLGVGQTALSHMEDRGDLKASSFIEYVEALGGRLEISARFGTLGKISLFDSLPVAAFAEVPSQQPVLPGLEDQVVARNFVLSIKPVYADQILAGSKTVEMRRRFTADAGGAWALIYSTTPDRALTGAARIEHVQKLALATLWKRHREASCLTKAAFDDYFKGTEAGYAISLRSPITFANPVPLPELRKRFGFEPPQSYQYASAQLSRLVDAERAKAAN